MKSGIFFVTTFFEIEISPSKRRRMVMDLSSELGLDILKCQKLPSFKIFIYPALSNNRGWFLFRMEEVVSMNTL